MIKSKYRIIRFVWMVSFEFFSEGFTHMPGSDFFLSDLSPDHFFIWKKTDHSFFFAQRILRHRGVGNQQSHGACYSVQKGWLTTRHAKARRGNPILNQSRGTGRCKHTRKWKHHTKQIWPQRATPAQFQEIWARKYHGIKQVMRKACHNKFTARSREEQGGPTAKR